MSGRLIDIIKSSEEDDDLVVDWDIRGTPITLGDLRRWENLKQKWETEENE